MLATFTPCQDNSPGTSILKPAHGHVLTVNLLGSGRRVVLIVSDRDHAKLGDSSHMTKAITVTDLMTGIEHRLTGDDCGLGCRCAITFAKGD
jgi:hypothetical protein